VRRPHPWLVTTDREARSPPAPDEGAAFNGWTGLDERQRQCCPDNVRCKSPVQAKKSRRPCKKSPRWSAGRRACRSHGTRAPSQKVPNVTCAVPALRSLTHVRDKGNEGAPRADQTTGAMTHVFFLLENTRVSAGCLTCESEMSAAYAPALPGLQASASLCRAAKSTMVRTPPLI